MVRFVLLGRGNERDTRELVTEPIARFGLENSVVLPGYLYEPDYSQALRALDLFLFLPFHFDILILFLRALLFRRRLFFFRVR